MLGSTNSPTCRPDTRPGAMAIPADATPPPPRTIEGLEINEVRDGLIVYDSGRDRVHYLNATASVVFTLCDGEHDASAMAAELAELFGVDLPQTEVDDCLARFATEGLLR
jgi:hypothetical protein